MKAVKQNTKNIDTNFKYNVIVTTTYGKDTNTYTFYAEDYDEAWKRYVEILSEHCDGVRLLSDACYVVGIYRTMHDTIEVVKQVKMQSMKRKY